MTPQTLEVAEDGGPKLSKYGAIRLVSLMDLPAADDFYDMNIQLPNEYYLQCKTTGENGCALCTPPVSKQIDKYLQPAVHVILLSYEISQHISQVRQLHWFKNYLSVLSISFPMTLTI